MVVRPPLPEASASEHGSGSTEVPEWQLLDWDDYIFPEGAGGAGGGGGSGADPFATMMDGLPGFIAEDIATLLRDLPLPVAGDIPGMTADEAIQVFHIIQHTTLYAMLFIMLCNIHDTGNVLQMCFVCVADVLYTLLHDTYHVI
jgi:hypothetical protein